MAERGRDQRGGKRFWGSLDEWRDPGEESTEDGPELELNGSWWQRVVSSKRDGNIHSTTILRNVTLSAALIQSFLFITELFTPSPFLP